MSMLLTGDTVAQWPVWSTTARVVVADPGALPDARALVEAELAAVDAACSRFRPDSELALAERAGEEVEVSELLAELVGAALDAARRTDGDVDPTLGDALARLGYDRDLPLVPPDGPAIPVRVCPAPGWRRVGVDGRRLSVPPGVRLDLGATAKAWTADRCARLAAGALDTGVLVELGGDLATAGAGPADGWRVYVADQPGDPACVVAVPSGSAMATSSTNSRSWRRGGRLLHHVLDPRTCQPAPRVWRSVTVVADRCVDANTLTTAALVRGTAALSWLSGRGVPARLVDDSGRVHPLGGWPDEP
ncbi:FAD:protein FMN transferase [Amycolatopsis acidiphila]|uniref:FAD:protein FMN transferase n=1 Tax=Amycolatopsis acidiphila TaxID=715473 RepID=A0A558A3I8_9PSEU|nr:FAD:protein FMN transferase [Amycolatopsis acidiphila]TVT18820.1 FAD:protein FMN transferase [Amycolatopsis acidiphila]UIJ61737.1 FAD:protein FMN transferase [Amycolatopsis acidiphila]GHG58131.1 FAD:protein FMN transferase [Amycolatopsis acidiphila]